MEEAKQLRQLVVRAVTLVFFLELLTACGGSSSQTPPPPPPPPTITSVTVTGNQSVVPVGQEAVFDATVKGTGQFNTSVSWSVNGVSGGDTADGTIAGGLYTAPANLPSTNPVTITATSVADPTKSGSITLAVF